MAESKLCTSLGDPPANEPKERPCTQFYQEFLAFLRDLYGVKLTWHPGVSEDFNVDRDSITVNVFKGDFKPEYRGEFKVWNKKTNFPRSTEESVAFIKSKGVTEGSFQAQFKIKCTKFPSIRCSWPVENAQVTLEPKLVAVDPSQAKVPFFIYPSYWSMKNKNTVVSGIFPISFYKRMGAGLETRLETGKYHSAEISPELKAFMKFIAAFED